MRYSTSETPRRKFVDKLGYSEKSKIRLIFFVKKVPQIVPVCYENCWSKEKPQLSLGFRLNCKVPDNI